MGINCSLISCSDSMHLGSLTPKAKEKSLKNKMESVFRADLKTLPHTIFDAALYENLTSLLFSGVDINATDNTGQSALHYAAHFGCPEVFENLVRAGANLNLTNKYGSTPLLLAAYANHLEIVEILMFYGADPTIANKFNGTPFEIAMDLGHHEIVQALTNIRSRVHETSSSNHLNRSPGIFKVNQIQLQTPQEIFTAILNGDIEDLLKNDVNLDIVDEMNMTALHLAAYSGHWEIVQTLVQVGVQLDLQDNYGSTALNLAAFSGHTLIVDCLLKAGADHSIPNKYSSRPILLACELGHLEIVELLVRAGTDLNYQNILLISPLIMAIKENQFAVVKFLLKYRPNLELKDKDGATALYNACELGYVEMVDVLLRAGANLFSIANNKLSPIQIACREGRSKVVEFILKSKYRSSVLKQYSNLIHLSACQNYSETLQILIAAGVFIDALDKDGWTALHYACQKGNLKIVKTLIQFGANLQKPTATGFSPLEISHNNWHDDIASVLIEAIEKKELAESRHAVSSW